MLAAVHVGDQQEHGEQNDAVAGVGFEEAVCPAGPVGESIDPAEDAAIHQCAPAVVLIDAVEGAKRSRIRRSDGHASTSASGGTRRAA